MNDRHDDSSSAPRTCGPDPLADLIRGAGRMPEPSATFKEELRQELAGVWQEQLRARRQRRRWSGAGIAATFVLLAIGFQWLQSGADAAGSVLRAPGGLWLAQPGAHATQARPGEKIPAGSSVATGDLPAALALNGGFNVRLDAHTRVKMMSAAHLALESGRLYVDSGEAPGALVIDTPFGAVHDIGTQFTVALREAGLTVQVRDGVVKLEQGASAVAVTPGHRVHVEENGETRAERIARSGGDWTWVESVAPALVTEGRSLYAFLEAVHRQTGLEVRYATPELASRAAGTIIGGRHPDLPPRQLLDVVMSATDFDHVVTESAIVIGGT